MSSAIVSVRFRPKADSVKSVGEESGTWLWLTHFLKDSLVNAQDKRNTHIGFMDNEFGGYYEDCSNKEFHCLTGPLEIIIPKDMPLRQWKYRGLSCQSVAQPVGDAYRITCRSHEYSGRHIYTYSLSHGVVSIESSPVASGALFKLRGDLGLFARKQSIVGFAKWSLPN